MGVNGIYGLSGSGIDVESMVKVGMLSKQKQYDKMQQNYTKNEWTKQAYNDIYNKLTTYSTSTLSPYKMSSSMSAKSAISSNSDAVTATANGNAVIMNHKVQVDALATSAYLVATESLSIINNDPDDPKNSVQLQDYIFKQSTYNPTTNTLSVVSSAAETGEGEDPAIIVNEETGEAVRAGDTAFEFWVSDGTVDDKGVEKKTHFSYTYGDLLGVKETSGGRIKETGNEKTFNDFVSDFNALGTNIRASYDAVGGKFSFYNKEGGEANKIQFTLSSGDAAINTAAFFQGMKLAQSENGELLGTDRDTFENYTNYIGSLERTAASVASTEAVTTDETDEDGNPVSVTSNTKLSELGYDFGENFNLSINGTQILAMPTMTSTEQVMDPDDETQPASLNTSIKKLSEDVMSNFDLKINGTQILANPSMTSTSQLTYDDNGDTRVATTQTALSDIFIGYNSTDLGNLEINGTKILTTPSMSSNEQITYTDDAGTERIATNNTTLAELLGNDFDGIDNNFEFSINNVLFKIPYDENAIANEVSEETTDDEGNPITVTSTEYTGSLVYTDPDTGRVKYGNNITVGDVVKMINAESDTTGVTASFTKGYFKLDTVEPSTQSSINFESGDASSAFFDKLNLQNDVATVGDLVNWINAESDTTNVKASFDNGYFNLTSTNPEEQSSITLSDDTRTFFNDVLQLDDDDVTIGDLVDWINAESDTTNVTASFDNGYFSLKSSEPTGASSIDITGETSGFFTGDSGILKLGNDDVTIGSLIDMINAQSETTKVVASFDEKTVDGSTGYYFNLTSTVKGENSKIDIETTDEAVTGAFLTDTLHLAAVNGFSSDEDEETETALISATGTSAAAADNLTFGISGSNGSVTIDGVKFDNLTDNSVTAYGVTYKLHNVTDSTVNVNIEQDVDAIVDKVKSFVEDYNTLLGGLYDKYNEKKYSDYAPLTASQKETMKDEQIEKWEEKAKSGLLYHDQTLSKIVTKMRSAISNPIEGLTGNYTSAYSIGISTTGIYGQLTLDEDKLRAALGNDSESVYNVISTLSKDDDFDKNGLAQRLGDVMVEATKLIKDRAGTDDSINDDSDLGSLMRELQNKMSDFKKLLDAFEDRLYKKYDAMEVALATLGTQLSYITGNQ